MDAEVLVALGSASPALRAGLAALLGEGVGVQIVASEALSSGFFPSVPATVWLVDEATLQQLDADAVGETALVVLAARMDGSGGLTRRLRPFVASGTRGFGLAVVPPDVTPEELRAAVLAADSGFMVLPPALLRDLLEPEVAGEAHGADAPELTARERDVLEGLAAGASNKRIASRLGVSPNTVKYHVASLYSKLGVSSRASAVREGVRLGLLSV